LVTVKDAQATIIYKNFTGELFQMTKTQAITYKAGLNILKKIG
jgi:hypothetical protein